MTAPDGELIRASTADPSAFATIFDRHAVSIRRFLARRVEPAEADGLVGEVFRIAFERRATFDPDRASARPWLYGIAGNVVARHRRSEHRRLQAMARLAARGATDDPDRIDERTADTIDAADAWTRLVDVIGDLPTEERETLLLYAWEELTYADIAAALDVPVGTVRSRLHRARARLRAAHPAEAEPTTKGTAR